MPRPCNVSLKLRLALGIVLLAGCGGGDGDGGTPPATTTIAKASASGDAQTGTVAQPLSLPLQVVVTEGGAPQSGATVTWSSTAPGASLEPTTATTDATGTASATWTLGTVSGSQTAQAALSGATGSPVSFTATAAPDAAATLSNQGGDNQTGEINTQLASPVQAKVSDQFGNGVAGVAVAWSATGATVSAASVPSDAAGISAVTVTLGETAGEVTITADAAGLAGSPLTFNATATEPAPIPSDAAVTVGNIFFQSNRNSTQNPAVDTVAVGGTVTWTWVNTGGEPHSVRSSSFTSSEVLTGSGQSYELTFSAAGTHQYDCFVHGAQMTGTVVVR